MTIKLNEDVHVGDTPVLRFTVKDAGVVVPLTAATTLEVNISKPSGAAMTRDLFAEDAENGIVLYSFLDGEVDESGHWSAQAYIEIPGWKGHAEKVTWYVKPVLPRETP